MFRHKSADCPASAGLFFCGTIIASVGGSTSSSASFRKGTTTLDRSAPVDVSNRGSRRRRQQSGKGSFDGATGFGNDRLADSRGVSLFAVVRLATGALHAPRGWPLREQDARTMLTSRGQDENSFGGTRADRWTQQKSGARISFKARRLVTPAGWIFHNAHRVLARQRWHLCPRSEQGPSTRLLSVIKIGLETGCTGNVQPAAARLVSGGPGIPACD
jgi:hypothetical protein